MIADHSGACYSVPVANRAPPFTGDKRFRQEAAYNFCFSKTNGGKRIGVGWGSIVGRMADYADTLEKSADVRGAVFPLAGGVNAVTRDYHTNELVRIFSLKAGRQPIFLYIPRIRILASNRFTGTR